MFEEDNDSEELWAFDKEKIHGLISDLKNPDDPWAPTDKDIDNWHNKFQLDFKLIDGAYYELSIKDFHQWINKMRKELADNAAMELVNKGLLELFWDDKENNFAFRKKKFPAEWIEDGLNNPQNENDQD